MKRTLALLLLLFITRPQTPSEAAVKDDEDAHMATFFKDYLEREFRLKPLDATRLGEHRFDHLLDDVSPKARADWLAKTRQALAELPKKMDYAKLSRSVQIDFEILKHHLTRNIWLAENTRVYEEDPRVYGELVTESVYLLLTQSTLPQATNVKNCLARMAHVPAVLKAARENLQKPPRVLVETAIRQNRGAIGFYDVGIYELAGETPHLSELKKATVPVLAALREYQTFLQEELLPRATGEWRLGKEKFAKKLDLELDAGITAEEVLKEAEAEADRVENEIYVIARQLWSQILPKRAPPDDAAGRRTVITQVLDQVSQEHGKPEKLVDDIRADAERIKAFIRDKDILKLPEPDRLKIIEMPEFQRGNSIAFLNPAPPLDPKAASYYDISPPPSDWSAQRVASFMQEYNRHMRQVLTIHEAYPGHYVQLEYSNRHPSLLRRVLSSGVFAEGWAVYTEQMMLDEGYGNGDLKLRLNQLKWYLRAVANAILDYRMHCANMTDEEALALLMRRAFQSEGEAILKVIRAKQSSCQLSTYFVGRMAFVRLRRRVQNEMGERFNLGRYHETVMSHGTLPVKYLPELVGKR